MKSGKKKIQKLPKKEYPNVSELFRQICYIGDIFTKLHDF